MYVYICTYTHTHTHTHAHTHMHTHTHIIPIHFEAVNVVMDDSEACTSCTCTPFWKVSTLVSVQYKIHYREYI